MDWKYAFCMCAIVVTTGIVHAELTADKFNVTVFHVYNEDPKTDENRIYEALTPSVDDSLSIILKLGFESTTAVISAICAEAGAAISIITATIETFSPTTEDQRPFAKAIVDAVERRHAEDSLLEFKSKLFAINGVLASINEQKNGENYSKHEMLAKVNDIQDIFAEIIPILDKDKVITKYPEMLGDVVWRISIAYSLFYPLFEKYDGNFAKNKTVPCKLLNVVEKYRDPYVFYRLSMVKAVHETSHGKVYPGWSIEAETPILIKVSCLPFNSNGYNENSLQCNQKKNAADIFRVLVRDLVTKKDYTMDNEDELAFGGFPIGCYWDYLKLVRFKVENTFKIPIDYLNNICEQRPAKTEFGWLVIKIKLLYVGFSHDLQLNTHNSDPYVKIFVDNDEKFQSKTLFYQNSEQIEFDEIFQSNKIKKNSSIRIDLWDYDRLDPDDLMFQWETTVDELLRNGCQQDHKGGLCVKAFWSDEFTEEN